MNIYLAFQSPLIVMKRGLCDFKVSFIIGLHTTLCILMWMQLCAGRFTTCQSSKVKCKVKIIACFNVMMGVGLLTTQSSCSNPCKPERILKPGWELMRQSIRASAITSKPTTRRFSMNILQYYRKRIAKFVLGYLEKLWTRELIHLTSKRLLESVLTLHH